MALHDRLASFLARLDAVEPLDSPAAAKAQQQGSRWSVTTQADFNRGETGGSSKQSSIGKMHTLSC